MILLLRVALLAPGVVLHELSHHLLCLVTGVGVRKTVYFRIGNPAGFVVHDEPELYRQLFGIVVGPLFINSAVSLVTLHLALLQWAQATDFTGFAIALGLSWTGISAALQALPSGADARNLFHGSSRHLLQGNLLAVVGYPMALAIYFAHLARPLGVDWLYALSMAYLAIQGFLSS